MIGYFILLWGCAIAAIVSALEGNYWAVAGFLLAALGYLAAIAEE